MIDASMLNSGRLQKRPSGRSMPVAPQRQSTWFLPDANSLMQRRSNLRQTPLQCMGKGDCERDEQCIRGRCVRMERSSGPEIGDILRRRKNLRQTPLQCMGNDDCGRDEKCIRGRCVRMERSSGPEIGDILQRRSNLRHIKASQCMGNSDCERDEQCIRDRCVRMKRSSSPEIGDILRRIMQNRRSFISDEAESSFDEEDHTYTGGYDEEW
jgi:hypothetical protein